MAAFGNQVFVLASTRGSNSFVHEVAVMDFNGDGKLDLLSAWFFAPLSPNSQAITVHLGNGDGTFRDGTATVIPGSVPQTVHPRELVLKDFNGDGRTDVFIADHGYDMPPFPGYQNQLLLSKANGTWANYTATNLPVASDFTHSATGADIDGDGDIDLYSGNLDGGGPKILLNNGNGKFTVGTNRLPTDVATPNGFTTFATCEFADFDGDGDQDLFLGEFQAGLSRILLNDGTGRFTNSPRELPPGPFGADSNFVDSHARDLNGDGRIDLVLDAHRSDLTGVGLQILINKGNARFVDETAQRVSANWANDRWVKYLHFADLNGDGFDDILTEVDGGSEILLNNGDGYFFEPLDNQFSLSGSLELGDFNGDGKVDVAYWAGPSLFFRAGTGQVAIQLTGTDGNNKLFGDGFRNTLDARGGNDTVRSGAGNDDVTGGTGADRLYGGTGNDILRGGSGVDTLQGEAGADRFVLSHTGLANADKVVDFRHGVDKIVLDAPRFDGGSFADLTYTATGKLYFDGALVATLVGAPPLTASDVLFL
jgi:Ca2+-binding RTX toxin-like protein